MEQNLLPSATPPDQLAYNGELVRAWDLDEETLVALFKTCTIILDDDYDEDEDHNFNIANTVAPEPDTDALALPVYPCYPPPSYFLLRGASVLFTAMRLPNINDLTVTPLSQSSTRQLEEPPAVIDMESSEQRRVVVTKTMRRKAIRPSRLRTSKPSKGSSISLESRRGHKLAKPRRYQNDQKKRYPCEAPNCNRAFARNTDLTRE